MDGFLESSEVDEDGNEYIVRTWTKGDREGRIERILKQADVMTASRLLIGPGEFFDRWTDDELENFEELTWSNKKAAAFKTRIVLSENIDLNSPRLRQRIKKLEEIGVLAVGRADEILG